MPDAPLGVTYYPACIVNLLIRFDESFNKAANQQQIALAKDTAATAPTNQVLKQLPNGGDLFNTQGNVAGSSVLGCVPLRGSIELNNIRKPSTFNLSFDYRDLPIDPRLVRSVGIEIFLDTMRGNSFAEAMFNLTNNGQTAPDPSRMGGFVPFAATHKNLVLKGVVDNWSVQHTSNGSIATLEGRDLVGVFLNTPVTAKLLSKFKPGDKDIVTLVRDLVGLVGTWTDKIDVEGAAPERWPDGVVPKIATSDKRLNPQGIFEGKNG